MLNDKEEALQSLAYDILQKCVNARCDRFFADWKKTRKRDKLEIIFGNGSELAIVNDLDVFEYSKYSILEDFIDDIRKITDHYTLTSPDDDINYTPPVK